MSAPAPAEISRLLEIMAKLRDPNGGCPWDLEQNFRTIAPYTIEEAYEVADAIERENLEDLRDELGDLLLQVVFHARMAEEEGAFAFADVVGAIADKMVRRHPHVFADEEHRDAAEQTAAWETQKAEERARKGMVSVFDDVPANLPALTRAVKLQKRAGRVGFDWDGYDGVIEKIREELGETVEAIEVGDKNEIELEIGDLLNAVANLARQLDIDPESALRRSNEKFKNRFQFVERKICRKQSRNSRCLTR